MVAFFLKRQLINERLAHNMLQWDHLRFQRRRFGAYPRWLLQNPRSAVAIHRPCAGFPQGRLIVEDAAATLLDYTAYNPYFRANLNVFRATDRS